jgi:hypothetical protein
VILAVALAALWFLPELWGSGKLFRSVDRAHQGNAGTPINAAVPWRAVLDQERYVLASAVKWAALAAGVIGAAVGLLKLRRRRRGERGEVTGGDNRALETLALALGALAFVAVVAAGTQWGGFSGNTRYLLLATATIAVIGGVGFGWVARGAGALVERRFGHRAGLAVTALAAVVALGFTWHFGVGHRLHEQNKVWNALDQAGRVRSDLEKTLPRLGGRDKALACGDVVTGRFQVPLLAWHLDVGFDRVSYVPVRATGVSFQTPGQGTQSRVALPSGFHRVLDLGAWRVAARCPAL